MTSYTPRDFSYKMVGGELYRLSLSGTLLSQEEWQEVATSVTTFVQKEPVKNTLKSAKTFRLSLKNCQVSHEKGELSPEVLASAKNEYSQLISLLWSLELQAAKRDRPLTKRHLDTLLRGLRPRMEERLHRLIAIEPTISLDTFKPESLKTPQKFISSTFYPIETAPQQYALFHVAFGKVHYYDPLGKSIQESSAALSIAKAIHYLHFPEREEQIETLHHTPQNIKSDSGRYLLRYLLAEGHYETEVDIPHAHLIARLEEDFQDIKTTFQSNYERLSLQFEPENRFRYLGRSYASPQRALEDKETGLPTDEKTREILEYKFFQDPIAKELLRSTGDLHLGKSSISVFLTDLRNNLPD